MALASAEHERVSRPKAKRQSTAHLKAIPETKSLREQIRAEAVLCTRDVDKSNVPSRGSLQAMAEDLLKRMDLEERFLGFTMVTISNEFWRDQLMAVPFSRRMLLLPHCLKHAEGCPADYDEFGLDCRRCGACAIADYKTTAEDLGYKVLVAEGTPLILKLIVSGYVDGIVGVACLNVLEKALDKVLKAGVPSLAVPLLSSDCKNTSVDEDWVSEVIALRQDPPAQKTRSYVPLLRAANEIFEPSELDRLGGRIRSTAGNGAALPVQGNGEPHSLSEPIRATEALAYNWLARGGKRFRPFISLAAYDALTGGSGRLGENDNQPELSDAVRRAALAIETFHKASLVHDDIEDDDDYRYGDQTMHRRHGVSVALNVGDYLIGLGYRLVSRETAALGSDCAADILDHLAAAHVRLCEGQGAELAWRNAQSKQLTPLDTLKIYALKTAPAFEVALYCGLRLAGPADGYTQAVRMFARHLGVAFQILNDLDDWRRDENNKLVEGQDVLAGRPTLLLALALEGGSPQQRAELLEILAAEHRSPETVEHVRDVFQSAGAFERAQKLVEKYRARAEEVADDAEPTALRELLYFLVDTVLDRQPPEEPELVTPTLQTVRSP